MNAKPPTSLDVARLAGVSQATVSYVLTDRPGTRISDETRARVREAADRLGYVPHAGARTLRTGRSGLVLMSMEDLPYGPLAVGALEGLDRELSRRGYTLVQYGARRLRGVPAARAWAELRPVAVVAGAGKLSRQAVDVLRSAGVRAVVAIGNRPSAVVPSVVLDHAGVGALAAGHLIDRGCRRLAAVVPTETGLREMGEHRLAGALQAAQARGVPVTRADLPFREDGAAALLDLWRSVDGVFAYNDDYAMLLMAVLRDAGVAVPGDLRVVGCDDLPLAALLRPRLTTVRLDVSMAPSLIVQRLEELMEAGDSAAPDRIDPWTATLVVRESS
ncbi:LacI family DNA-binding transcriptional regulator [Planomonospora venezuelensis]|uniref:DNA-binding LacI/PurR family transcriptional regulator n=1 Tax=Planomonospora venezuelensis TaxID=1999 RepID=A0A841D4R4_PLAVE|nr:LacI family DNA-binding transcriptional regulator [Planomonospora venezuelensis]MBB5963953.1 DNA-binding LacI/PurR family transcriptional regulator [Planomonospora venezuelensis]GIN03901.1 LacI family transcriptional regulator [Planomonospora venezuelensis]